MARLFGTDGVRGIANVELTCEMAYRLGQAAAMYLGKTIVVGRDTRYSGDMLGAALSAGIMSAGGTVLEAGIIPTPGVALLVREMRAAGGAVISASHNPPEYNGIKLFDSAGSFSALSRLAAWKARWPAWRRRRGRRPKRRLTCSLPMPRAISRPRSPCPRAARSV